MASTNEFGFQPTPGPYIMKAGSLWQARRIYNDSSNTLLTTILPDADSMFRTMRLLGDEYQALSVAVPSRTCREKSSTLPLAGTRIVVKDMFDIKGLRTSVGNRNFFNLYPACIETATAIQRLIDAGAEVLGKSKLSSFAAREEPTESVDYQALFNPRGDGYQSPAGSSSGSAAAVSSYDWLDFAIGSDISATGSGRRPAHWNGCFSLRPTKTAFSLKGFVKTFEIFDVPCFFGRDISKFKDFARAWYGADLQSDQTTQLIPPSFAMPNVRIQGKPPKLLYLVDFMLKIEGEQKRLVDGFVRDLESALGVERTVLSLSRVWETTAPENLAKQGLQEYMQNAPTHAFFYDLYHNFDKFREDFDAKYNKAPYVSPMLRWRWLA
ncbi:hypothetical protein MMC17_007322 [Xylographa soralifera]|nr:hypothetical protein [Xylographa soralifera]